MKETLVFLILLSNILFIQSDICTNTRKKAALSFYHQLPKEVSQSRTIVDIISKNQIKSFYYITGNQTGPNSIRALGIQCNITRTGAACYKSTIYDSKKIVFFQVSFFLFYFL